MSELKIEDGRVAIVVHDGRINFQTTLASDEDLTVVLSEILRILAGRTPREECAARSWSCPVDSSECAIRRVCTNNLLFWIGYTTITTGFMIVSELIDRRTRRVAAERKRLPAARVVKQSLAQRREAHGMTPFSDEERRANLEANTD